MVSATTMRILTILAFVVSVPAAAFGQPAIGGVVSDPSGAPMAGVVVEASSAALIEKTRMTVTDAAGRYRIEDLLPGTYRVRFTLQGWKPYQQEGIELAGSFTAVVNAELAVGSMTETITVIAETPAIDVHSATREVTLSGDLVQSIPTARSYNALVALIPGVITNVNDTVTGTAATSFPIHGGRTNEGRLSLDGLTVGSPPGGNSATSYVIDVGQSQEVTFVTAGGLGESETAGLTMNIVPKSGGNTLHGSLFASGTAANFHSNNLTAELTAQGVTAPTPLKKVYDLSGTVGGPIVTDRLWYFVNGHTGGSTRESASVYYNLNAGDPNRWLYAPDVSRKEYSDRTFENASGRLTWQVKPRHKVSGFWDVQSLCRACTGATAGGPDPARVSPEAVGVLGRRLDVTQVTWSSPLTNRLIAEAGYGGIFYGVGNFEREPNPTRDLIRVAEQCATGCAANGNIPGLVYRSQDFSVAHTGSYLWKGSIAYVTGHAQSEDWLSAHVDDRRSAVVHEQSEPDLPRRQRRAESAHAIDFALGERRARRLGRAVRSRAVDASSSDAAGGRAIRSCTELVSCAAGRAVSIPANADRHSRKPRR